MRAVQTLTLAASGLDPGGKMFNKVPIGVIAVVTLLALVGFLLPREVHLERSTVFNASPEQGWRVRQPKPPENTLMRAGPVQRPAGVNFEWDGQLGRPGHRFTHKRRHRVRFGLGHLEQQLVVYL